MKIAPSLAQKIVDTLKKTLDYNINFMNTDGYIIASSDENRINNFHEGSVICIKKQDSLFIESDTQYEGSKRGINTPIYFEDSIIGVIGMSGNKEVLKFTRILKAMTEILIKESYLNEVSFQRRDKNRLIVNSLIFGLEEDKLEIFSLDSNSTYRVVVGHSNKTNLYSVLESINKQILFTIDDTSVTFIIPEDDHFDNILDIIVKKTSIYLGVGTQAKQRRELIKSYEAAKKALNFLMIYNPLYKISYFQNLDLEIILSDTKEDSKELFLQKVFKNINEVDLMDLYIIFKSYAKHNGSIKNMSEELFTHKNTIQYQLNKLKKLTQYDARNYNDFSILNLAFTLYYLKLKNY